MVAIASLAGWAAAAAGEGFLGGVFAADVRAAFAVGSGVGGSGDFSALETLAAVKRM